MVTCLTENYARFQRYAKTYLFRVHSGIAAADYDDLIGDAVASVIENERKLEERYNDIKLQRASFGRALTIEAWTYGCLKMGVRVAASKRYRYWSRNDELYDTGTENESNDRFNFASAINEPEQMDAVFRGELLDLVDRLPPDDKRLMLLIFDRATSEEMQKELGISPGELLRQRLRAFNAINRLAEAA